MGESFRARLQKAGSVKYVLIVAAAGLVLLLWPSGGGLTDAGPSSSG